MDISWDIIFFGVFMLLNLLQTILLTIFILKVRKNKADSENANSMQKNLNNLPLTLGNKKHDKLSDIEYPEHSENIYEMQDGMYSGLNHRSSKVQEDNQGIYEELQKTDSAKVVADEASVEESDTYDHIVDNTNVYDQLAHLGVSSKKVDPSYDTVKQ